MNDNFVSKCAVSVTEMARAVGLSRARFYQLVKQGRFPPPDKEPITGRPCYYEDGQRRVMEVRRRNCGIDGKPVLFYARRRDCGYNRPKPPKPKPEVEKKDVNALVAGLNTLGLTTATAAQVQVVTNELYPGGTAGIDQGVVLKAVFLELHRRNSSGSAG